MKKILGISLVAVLAVSPMMAMAAGTDTAPSSSFSATTSGLASDGTNVVTAAKGAYYAGKTISDTDRQRAATAAYVKGAYNDTISAINKVAADKQNNLSQGNGVTISNDTVSAKAGNGIEVDSTGIKAKASNGITVDSNGISVKPKSKSGITVDSTGVSVTVDNSTIAVDSTSGAVKIKDGVQGTSTETYTDMKALTTKGYVDEKLAAKQGNVTAGNGIAKNGDTISADLTSKGGLKLNGSTDGSKTIGVQTDGSTLEVDSSTGNVQIKAKGVTFGKMADAAVATSVAATGSTSAQKLTTESAVRGAIDALDATPSQTAAAANGNLALSITEVDGKITGISGSVQHQSLADYAKKTGVTQTITNSTISASVAAVTDWSTEAEGSVDVTASITGAAYAEPAS
jgi:hypothetical protein